MLVSGTTVIKSCIHGIGHKYVSVYKLGRQIVTLKSFYQYIFCPTSETTLALERFAIRFTFH